MKLAGNSAMLKDSQKYLEIVNRRGKEGKELRRVYHNLQRPGLFLQAYGNLYANDGALTPGPDSSDTIDGMSMEAIEKLCQALQAGTFQWRPVRRVAIPKKKGGTRPLGLPNWTDKLVQEVIRLVLEAYYEPQFSEHSHAYRTGRGCHTALQQIKQEWIGVKWFIEGDIKGCFDNLNHQFLLATIKKQIKDERFLKLLAEMLEAGFLINWEYQKTYSGVPQGGVVSPLLSNIYLHELDLFVSQTLLPMYNQGESARRKRHSEYQRLYQLAAQAWQQDNRQEYRTYRQAMQKLPVYRESDDYRRLWYVRYADDFLLGFAGPKTEAEEIKSRLAEFLTTIHLTMSEAKTLITHAADEQADFLGYDIGIAWANSKQTHGKRSINGKPMLRVPAEVKERWLARYQAGKTTLHRPELESLSDYEITLRYNADLLGLVNYYKLAVNVTQLYRVKWVMMQSLVKTIARKHQQTAAWVYQKYRAKSTEGCVCLRVIIEREEKEPLIAEFGAQPIRYDRKAILQDRKPTWFVKSRNEITARLLANTCELCGQTGPVQGHHIRKLADLKRRWRGRKEPPLWVQQMITRNRKTLFVCQECHLAIHKGEYDGQRLTL